MKRDKIEQKSISTLFMLEKYAYIVQSILLREKKRHHLDRFGDAKSCIVESETILFICSAQDRELLLL